MDLATSAQALAEALVAPSLSRRWKHVQAVAKKALRLQGSLPDEDRPFLVAAAWLHDIGYSPQLVATGLHALDGARWLLSQGFDGRVAGLVAHHSCAVFEAEERGLAGELCAEFRDEKSPVRDALWYADMTTGPDGQDMAVQERLGEIRVRYGPDHLVTRFWARAESALLEAVARTENRIEAARHQPM